MKCAKFGVAAYGSTVDISDLNLSSAEDYMLVINGDGSFIGYGNTQYSVYIDIKTATEFKISNHGANPYAGNYSYQVITFR